MEEKKINLKDLKILKFGRLRSERGIVACFYQDAIYIDKENNKYKIGLRVLDIFEKHKSVAEIPEKLVKLTGEKPEIIFAELNKILQDKISKEEQHE